MAEISLQGTELRIVERKLASTETVSLPLDGLRLAYLFLPQGFRWHLLDPSQTIYHYLDLDSLSEADYQSVHQQIATQWKHSWGDFKFVLKDLDGHTKTINWKELSRNGIDLMPALAQHRDARRKNMQAWLQAGGKTTIRNRGLGGADVTMDTQGLYAKNRSIPWPSLGRLYMTQASQFGSTASITFFPSKASHLKAFGLLVPGKQVEEVLAEVSYWQLQALGAEGLARANEQQKEEEKAAKSQSRRLALIIVGGLSLLVCVIMAIMLALQPLMSGVFQQMVP